MEWTLRNATEADVPVIEAVALQEQLDSRDPRPEQFVIAEHQGEVVGFGRIIRHRDCWEVACLYVARDLRRLGLGSDIVQELLSRMNEDLPVYAVTSLPEFFGTLGFVRVKKKYPAAIRAKFDYCRTAFDDEVVVMCRES